MASSHTFIFVAVFIFLCQVALINVGGEFLKVNPLNLTEWLITIALGVVVIPLGVISRFMPVEEDPEDFFDNSISASSRGGNKVTPIETEKAV